MLVKMPKTLGTEVDIHSDARYSCVSWVENRQLGLQKRQ